MNQICSYSRVKTEKTFGHHSLWWAAHWVWWRMPGSDGSVTSSLLRRQWGRGGQKRKLHYIKAPELELREFKRRHLGTRETQEPLKKRTPFGFSNWHRGFGILWKIQDTPWLSSWLPHFLYSLSFKLQRNIWSTELKGILKFCSLWHSELYQKS